MSAAIAAVILIASLSLAGCKQPAPQGQPAAAVTVSEARLVLPIIAGDPAAAYFTASNGSDSARRIASVEVAGAEMAMIHETAIKDGKTGMAMLDSVPIPPHGSVVFTPGGKHVMIEGLSPAVKLQGKTSLTLTLDDGAKVQAELAVESATAGQ